MNAEENDTYIRENFGDALLKLDSGEYNGWEHDRDGILAAILCYDQFSRNIHRKSPRAFDYDEKALKLCKKVMRSSDPSKNLSAYKFGELLFLLMPLMHSENKNDTAASVHELEKCHEQMEADDNITWNFSDNVKAAKDHHNTIEKFGRFPTRNNALGRESTEAERAYLESANSYG